MLTGSDFVVFLNVQPAVNLVSNRIIVVSDTLIGGSYSVIPDGDRTDSICSVLQAVVVVVL
jgi:hypothetical protein